MAPPPSVPARLSRLRERERLTATMFGRKIGERFAFKHINGPKVYRQKSPSSTVFVDAEYDNGPIVAQCRVPVVQGDTAETPGSRLLEREHQFLVETLVRLRRVSSRVS